MGIEGVRGGLEWGRVGLGEVGVGLEWGWSGVRGG